MKFESIDFNIPHIHVQTRSVLSSMRIALQDFIVLDKQAAPEEYVWNIYCIILYDLCKFIYDE